MVIAASYIASYVRYLTISLYIYVATVSYHIASYQYTYVQVVISFRKFSTQIRINMLFSTLAKLRVRAVCYVYFSKAIIFAMYASCEG